MERPTTTRRWFLGGATAALLAAPMRAMAEPEIDTAGLAWSELRGDSDRLLRLALDFHARLQDMDDMGTDTGIAATLPLALVNEARRIEKAARAIQDRLKGVP